MANFSMFVAIMTLAFAGCSIGADVIIPPGCEGKSYCTIEPQNYQNHVEDFDRFMKKSKYWAGLSAKNSNIEDLMPSFHPDSVNCGSVTSVEKPFTIKVIVNTTNSENKLVVQSHLLEQKIRTTTCLNKEESCFDAIKTEQGDIETVCDERYSTITLYVYDGKAIHPQPFPIPVSCACKVQFKKQYEEVK